MQKPFPLSCLWILPILFGSCSIVSPVFNQYETAKTLKKGNIDLMGNFTGYNAAGLFDDGAAVNKNLGIRVGIGLNDKTDLKLRYERLMATKYNEDLIGANFYSLMFKFSLKEDKIALMIPISYYSSRDKTLDEDTLSYNFSSLSPQLFFTHTNKHNTIDLTGSLKAEILFASGGGGMLPGITASAGFSSDLDKWAIRPEIGVLSLGSIYFLSYGIGVQIIID